MCSECSESKTAISEPVHLPYEDMFFFVITL